MATQIVGTYTLQNIGYLATADLAARMAAAPIDADFLYFWGLSLTSDMTVTAGSTVTRTITLAMGPGTDAVLTAHLGPGDPTGSPVFGLTPGTIGSGYVRPPSILLPPSAGTTADIVAKATANLGVVVLTGVVGGAAYPVGTSIVATGGRLAFGGAQATFNTTNTGGVLSATVATPGGPYNAVPTITTIGPSGGTGFSATALLGVESATITQPGKGYTAVTPVVTPYFKTLVPDAAGPALQAQAVQDFMLAVLEQATRGSITCITIAS